MPPQGKYSAAFYPVEKNPQSDQRLEDHWAGQSAGAVGDPEGEDGEPQDETARQTKGLGSLGILVLFEDPDRRMLAEYGVFGDQDFFHLLL